MLPKISHPTFSILLPSTRQEIIYRPFLVKEEKILLIAQQAQDPIETIRAIKNVIQNCIVSKNVTVEDFATFDLEYFFIKLRSKSVNNLVTLSFKDNEDNQVYDFEIDLEQVELKYPEKHDNHIKVNDQTSIKLRYPRLEVMEQVRNVENASEFVFLLLKNCLYQIVHEGKTFDTNNYSNEEVDEFINSLDLSTYQKIQGFFDSIPKLEHVLTYTNSNGKEVKIVLNNLNDFFTLG
ncbi:hypothetical protein EB118_02940 [bacterium]|nr:hypothetical protein [bacterium]